MFRLICGNPSKASGLSVQRKRGKPSIAPVGEQLGDRLNPCALDRATS